MNTNFLNSVTNFVKKRTFELIGLLLIFAGIALLVSFATYSPGDPSFVYGEKNLTIKNFFGIYGSIVSDFFLQSFGLISFLLTITITSWGVSLITKKEIKRIIIKLFFLILYLIFGTVFIYINYNNSFWLIDNGNSGFLGQLVYSYIYEQFPEIKNHYTGFILFFSTFIFFILASDINLNKIFLSIFNFRKK